MAALNLTLDYPLKVLSEPGFCKNIPSRDLSAQGQAALDGDASHRLWTEPTTKTVMLRPLQFDATWLNSTNQLPWIIRLANLDVNPTDTANGLIYEQPAYGNTANPWIYFPPTLPSGYFPTVLPEGEFPGTPPSLIGIDPGPILPSTLTTVQPVRPTVGYQIPPTMPAAGSPPTPVQTVDTTTGRHICQSSTLLPNQGLYIRWTHAHSSLGFPPVYRFYIGQFCLDVKEVVVQVYQDDSAHGDRSSFRHVATLPLFSAHDEERGKAEMISALFQSVMHPHEIVQQERGLCWLPFRRNQVHISGASSHGHAKSCLIYTRPDPQMLPDGSDWDNVRADKLVIWALTPKLNRIQIQRLAYATGGHGVNSPLITLDYTPATPPTTIISGDTQHGTAISVVQSSPPSYTYPVNNARECVTLPTYSSYQARQYGYVITLTASSDGAWSPYFYNLQVKKDPILITPTKPTPTTVTDTTGNPRNTPVVLSASCTGGRKPGEGRASLEAMDYSPYNLANYYYRCGQPVQIKNGATSVFVGYTLPQGVEPLKLTDLPRKISFAMADRWWQLDNYFLRDNRDWTGVGHQDCVQSILQQAGVDTTGIDSPPKVSPYNQIIGEAFPNQDANQQALQTLSPWQPKPLETAGSFVRRIAEHWSAWEIGFHGDGTPFYRPRYYYTAVEQTFYESKAAATADGHPTNPIYRQATFSTIEPEANCVVVYAYNRKGGPLISSVFIDWQSVLNTNAVNYLGRRKFLGVQIAGALSCSGINMIARNIWNIARRRHVIARFNCDYDDKIKVGRVITLHGYGNYRIISYTHNFRKQKWQTSTVEAEFVESGFDVTGPP